MGGRLADFLGQGLASARPVAATIPGLTQPFACAFYFGNDTKILSVYDADAIDWLEIDVAALAAIAFSVLPDVDWSTPPTNGQVFAWNTGTSKLTPLTLLYNTAEELQDAVGPMFHNGTGITAAYNDATGQVDIACTITQYTDEMAEDAMAAAFAAGTHTGFTVTYDDALNKYSFAVSAAYVTAGAVAAIAAASIADLVNVGSIAGITNGQGLVWNSGAGEFQPGSLSGYTDEQVRDAVAAMLAAGTHVGITVTNNDAGDSMSLTAPHHGALVSKASAMLTANYSGTAILYWDLETYDTDSIHGFSSTVTITIATPGVITWTGHNFLAGSPISLATTGALPTGLTAGTVYYVVNPAANTFQLAASPGGAAINTTGSQSGVHTATNNSRFVVPAGLGITYAEVKCQVATLLNTNDSILVIQISKNGSILYPGIPHTRTGIPNTDPALLAASPWLPVVAGDYFEVIFTDTDASVTIQNNSSWFSINFK